MFHKKNYLKSAKNTELREKQSPYKEIVYKRSKSAIKTKDRRKIANEMTTDVNINLECTKNKRGSIPLGIPLSSSHKSSNIFLDKTEYSDMEVDCPATVAIHSSQEGLAMKALVISMWKNRYMNLILRLRQLNNFRRKVMLKSTIHFVKECGDSLLKDLNNNYRRFDTHFRGSCILQASLLSKKCSDRTSRNFIRILNIVAYSKFKPIKATKTGFRMAELIFRNPIEANTFLDYHTHQLEKELGINFSIPTCSLFKKVIIRDWELSIPKLIETIADKTNIMSIERMSRKYLNKDNNTFCKLTPIIL